MWTGFSPSGRLKPVLHEFVNAPQRGAATSRPAACVSLTTTWTRRTAWLPRPRRRRFVGGDRHACRTPNDAIVVTSPLGATFCSRRCRDRRRIDCRERECERAGTSEAVASTDTPLRMMPVLCSATYQRAVRIDGQPAGARTTRRGDVEDAGGAGDGRHQANAFASTSATYSEPRNVAPPPPAAERDAADGRRWGRTGRGVEDAHLAVGGSRRETKRRAA